MKYLNDIKLSTKLWIGLFATISIIGVYKLITYDPNEIVPNNKFIDSNNEYIINPNIEMLRKFEWADYRDSAGGRLSREPSVFLEIKDELKTKEVPFDWNSVKRKTALEKRNAYFNHLCNTEASSYETSDIPVDLANNPYSDNYNLFIIRKNEYPVRNMKDFLENYPYPKDYRNSKEQQKDKLVNEILTTAQQNPYIFPEYGFYDFERIQGRVINFFLREPSKKDIENYKNNPNFGHQKTVFREYMDQDGDIYRIKYDFEKKEYLPLVKIKKSDAEYYTIFREIERPEMKKLGIYGRENIWVRVKDKKIIKYYKGFSIPRYLDSMRGSNFTIPIDWRNGIGCNWKTNQKIKNKVLKNLDSLQ